MDQFLRVPDWPDVWAVGDCAFVPDVRNPGKSHPPTAQHAIREGHVVAQNIVATLVDRPLKSFSFRSIGLLASIGRRMGVARIFGFNFSSFFAWWIWRTVYLSKLPGLDKKIRVAFDWTLDLLFPKDVCAVYDLDQHGRAAGLGLLELAQRGRALGALKDRRPHAAENMPSVRARTRRPSERPSAR